MGILDFVASLEWPLIVGAALFYFRKQISTTLEAIADTLHGLRPTRLKGFGLDAEFESKLQKAEVLTQGAVQKDDAIASPGPDPSPKMAFDQEPADRTPSESATQPTKIVAFRLGEDLKPIAGVLQSYSELEEVINRTARQIAGTNTLDTLTLRNAAKRIGFNEDELAALEELSEMRNAAAHRSNIDLSRFDALRYAGIAKHLSQRAYDLYINARYPGQQGKA